LRSLRKKTTPGGSTHKKRSPLRIPRKKTPTRGSSTKKRGSRSELNLTPSKKIKTSANTDKELEMATPKSAMAKVKDTTTNNPETVTSPKTPKGCSNHGKELWGSWEAFEHTGYIIPGGDYFGRHCSGCRKKFTNKKNTVTTTSWNNANPARCCKQCALFLVCHKCYTSFLLESDVADINDPRISIRRLRAH
jgi:hypothetical protein